MTRKWPDYYHPGRSARVVMDGETVAQFGQIDPSVAAARKLRQEVFIGEVFLDRLYRHDLRKILYEPLPRYPAVERDFSFTFSDDGDVRGDRKLQSKRCGLTELREFTPVEIFRGGKVGTGKYSILLRALFQSHERTLREDEVGAGRRRSSKALESLGGTLRS